MSNEFLAAYHIPTIQTVAAVPAPTPTLPPLPPPPPGVDYSMAEEPAADYYNQYENINRFIPPGLHGTTSYALSPNKPLKRKYDAGPGYGKKTTNPPAETTPDGKLAIFHGRDESYPEELNKLIHPLHCSLCNVQMNSVKSAKDHYESKLHDRQITTWLTKNFTEKGLEPPAVKRFIKTGPVGPDAFRCDICDLSFSSLPHASQHFAGRKHRLVANRVSNPSGSGYYDANGKWVRTGSKFTPTVANDGRFGIGEQFKQPSDVGGGATSETDCVIPDTTTTTTITAAGPTIAGRELPALYCEICKVHVTSHIQMKMHLDGVKHKKKLKTLSLEGAITVQGGTVVCNKPADAANSTDSKIVMPCDDSILASLKQSDPTADYSMYRTPSGSYYCETCNMNMCHVTALQQHLMGKKHIKKVNDKKEKIKTEAKSKA